MLLRRTLRAELALGAAALAVTGALAGYAPATAQTAGPFSGSADLGPARAELTVEPARAGANEIHVYLFARSDGRQYDAPKELRFEASLPERGIEPIRLEARKAGPGHYVVGAARAGPAGRVAPRARRADLGLRRAPHHLHGPDRMKEERTVRRSILAAVAAAALLAPAAAQAHVTLQPDTAPAGGFTRLDVRVPNERDDAGTTKVDVQLPPGFIAASYEPVPGWDVKVSRSQGRRADRRRRGPQERRAGLPHHVDRRRRAGRDRARRSSRTSGSR